MYRHLQRRLADAVRDFLRRAYGLELDSIVIEQPPKVELGEYALPLAFELAKKLRKPRAKSRKKLSRTRRRRRLRQAEVAGAGYINARVDRAHGRCPRRRPKPAR